jgi:hypothetical protein
VKDKGILKSEKLKSKTMGVMEEVEDDIKNTFEGPTKVGVDVFKMLKRVPMFTGSEDVEEWLWNVGFLFKKYPNKQEELIEEINDRLAGKPAQFFRMKWLV